MAKERSAMALTRACARSSLTRARLACRARRALILRSTRVRVFPSTPDLEEGTKQGVVRVRRCQSGNSQGKNIRRSWYLDNVIFVIGFEFRRDCYHDMKTQPTGPIWGESIGCSRPPPPLKRSVIRSFDVYFIIYLWTSYWTITQASSDLRRREHHVMSL